MIKTKPDEYSCKVWPKLNEKNIYTKPNPFPILSLTKLIFLLSEQCRLTTENTDKKNLKQNPLSTHHTQLPLIPKCTFF